MNRTPMANCEQSIARTIFQTSKRLVIFGTVALAMTFPALSQNEAVQEKLAAVKQAAAENKQKIRQYQWIETTQLSLKGDPKPRRRTVACTAPTARFKRP